MQKVGTKKGKRRNTMTINEALKLALAKENASVKLYRDMSNKYPEIKDLLDLLLNEEFKHIKLIEGKLVELTKY